MHGSQTIVQKTSKRVDHGERGGKESREGRFIFFNLQTQNTTHYTQLLTEYLLAAIALGVLPIYCFAHGC